ncbi:SURF1 family protein [bacterium]|nr:SURF1 family protein [bacterium]
MKIDTFKFSVKITLICTILASAMLWAASWQWSRYHEKLELLASYEKNSTEKPIQFNPQALDPTTINQILNRKVYLKGRYDFSRQVIVTNRKHRSGPGHWLVTPFKIAATEEYILVSRGFIPFADLTKKSWEKYNFTANEELVAVVKKTNNQLFLGPKNPATGPNLPFQYKFFFPEVAKISAQLPYPVIQPIFLQRVGAPEQGEFPAQSISIEVPPSTHFGYTIEWSLLALVTVVLGFMLQAYPGLFTRKALYLSE